MKGYLSTPGVSGTEELDNEREGVIVGVYKVWSGQSDPCVYPGTRHEQHRTVDWNQSMNDK